MTTITVTTSDDVVSSGDGQTSLREAVAEAHAGDTIVFSGVNHADLSGELSIGKDITIDGTGGGLGQFYAVNFNGAIVVKAGADVTLSHLEISGGAIGANGVDGAEGGEGAPATDGKNGGPGQAGSHGTDGGAGDNGGNGTAGQAALAGIENDGTLTLDHVELDGLLATGGDGGEGGKGGNGNIGGRGGNGGDGLDGAAAGNGARGGAGGSGGGGGLGARGGNAVAGILNTGTLTLKDSMIHGAIAEGGDGGKGGWGGAGLDGGRGGGGGNTFPPTGGGQAGKPGNGAHGGDAGNGGAGANGGRGGTAVAGILNQGSITVVGTTLLFDEEATKGKGGSKGNGRPGGTGGTGGAGGTASDGSHAPGDTGLNGTDGVAGTNGARGRSGTQTAGLSGAKPVSGSIAHHHFYEFDQTGTFTTPAHYLVGGQGPGIGTTVTLRVEMLGDTSTGGSVHWQVAGAPAADFQGGTLPSGTLTFSAGQRFQDVSFAVLPDAAAPRSETLKLTLSQPASGDSLGVHSAAVHLVNVHVTSGDDHIVATDDSDVVTTLDGNDFVYGEGGDDSLDGGKGSDALHGGTGNDYLTGGAGKDSFVFDTTPDAVHNLDHISDFTVGEDNIKLDHAIFTALGGPGALTAGYFYAGPAAHDGDDRIIYDPGSGDLFYDTNGSAAGGSTEFAVLAKNLALTAGDFLVI